MSFPPKTEAEWETWWEGFKKRNGLPSLPVPPPDAKAPPKPHSETDKDEEAKP